MQITNLSFQVWAVWGFSVMPEKKDVNGSRKRLRQEGEDGQADSREKIKQVVDLSEQIDESLAEIENGEGEKCE